MSRPKAVSVRQIRKINFDENVSIDRNDERHSFELEN